MVVGNANGDVGVCGKKNEFSSLTINSAEVKRTRICIRILPFNKQDFSFSLWWVKWSMYMKACCCTKWFDLLCVAKIFFVLYFMIYSSASTQLYCFFWIRPHKSSFSLVHYMIMLLYTYMPKLLLTFVSVALLLHLHCGNSVTTILMTIIVSQNFLYFLLWIIMLQF